MSEKYFMDNGDYINEQNKCCSCSKRTKWIICGLVALPFVVIAILIIACMINTSLYDDPFELVKVIVIKYEYYCSRFIKWNL